MLLKERLLRRTNISSENTHISSTQLTVNANCETTHFDCLVRVMGDQRWCVYFEILGCLPGSFNAIFTDKFSVISRGRSADIPTREHPSDSFSSRSREMWAGSCLYWPKVHSVCSVCNPTRGLNPSCLTSGSYFPPVTLSALWKVSTVE